MATRVESEVLTAVVATACRLGSPPATGIASWLTSWRIRARSGYELRSRMVHSLAGNHLIGFAWINRLLEYIQSSTQHNVCSHLDSISKLNSMAFCSVFGMPDASLECSFGAARGHQRTQLKSQEAQCPISDGQAIHLWTATSVRLIEGI